MSKEKILEFFNQRAPVWDEIINHNGEKIKYLLQQIKIKKNHKVLDVGTGTGILIPFLREFVGKEGKIIAVDISPEMIKIAKEKYSEEQIQFILGDVNEINLDELSFDRVICYSVFPHFLKPEITLKNLWRFLKYGGQIIICHSESKEIINSRHQSVGAQEISLGLPPVEELEKMLIGIGFKVLQKEDNENVYYIIGEK